MKKLLLILLLIPAFAWGADSLVTVCASGCDFTSIQAAIADINGDNLQTLLGDGYNYIVEVDSAIDVTACDISGVTADANNYINIRPASGAEHGGTWNIHTYIYQNAYFRIDVPYTIVDGLQFENTYTGASTNYTVDMGAGGATNRCTVRNCIIRRTGAASGILVGIRAKTDTAYIYNNLVYDFNNNDGSTGITDGGAPDSSVFVFNNTIANCAIGIGGGSYNIMAINNIVWGCSLTVAAITYANGTSWNATDSSTFGYTVNEGGGNDSTDAVFSFAGSGSDDWQLTAAFLGTDLSSHSKLSFSTDINGVTRTPSAWDRGAFQHTAAAAEKKWPIVK